MLSTYAQYQTYARDPNASLKHVAAEPTVARDTAYFRANIGKVKSVDDFLGNYRLFSYAMKSYGLGDAIGNRGLVKKVLQSDLTDPKSFANTFRDARYKTLALAFNFAKTGAVSNTAVAQDAVQQSDTLARYGAQTLTGKFQGADLTYYKDHIDRVASADGLIADGRLYRIALQAYGIDPSAVSTATIRRVFQSDTFDPDSMVDTSGHPTDAAQSAADTEATVAGYMAATGADAASQARATIETVYFRGALPGVTSVDDMLSDDRLVAYATTAFGLDFGSPAALALANANGADVSKPLPPAMKSDILRAALTSDLTDPASVADRLAGGFKAAAAAFDFGPTSIQSPAGLSATTALYGRAVGSDAAAAAETRHYAATVPTVKTADQFLADPRLFAYVQQAYGLTFPAGSAAAAQAATVRAALTGDPTDPQGAAARAGSAFVTFAKAFNSARPVYAQAPDSAESTVDLYGQAAGQTDAAAAETQYYFSTMPRVKTADALVADARLSAYLTTAYGIASPPGAAEAQQRAQLKTILTSEPMAAGATFGDGARRLAAAFQFDGGGLVRQGRNAVVASGLAAQPPAALVATVDLYTERLGVDRTAQVKGADETAYYKAKIAGIGTVDDFVADPRLVDYAAAAYGVAFPGMATKADRASQMRGILTSDIGDPKSVASQLGDSARQLAAAFTFDASYRGDAAVGEKGQGALVRLASAFNFDRQGAVTARKLAQSARDTQTTLSAYVKQAGTAKSDAAEADAAYYAKAIGQVKTLGGLLSDPRLVEVATLAFGIVRDPTLSDARWAAQLKGVLTSDVADPKSVASKLGPAYRRLAAAFTFAADGSVTRDPAQVAQSKKAAVLAADLYTQQAMNEEAGTRNTAVRLALNFQQQAPNITNVYQILADKSLLAVVQTAFNLPTSMSTLNIDTQARVISDALKIKDLQDPKKVARILKDYTIKADIAAAKGASSSSILTLFEGDAGASASSVLGIFNPAPQAVDKASTDVLRLFNLG